MEKGDEDRDCDGDGGDGFIDRSRVRILLCDNDANSTEEVFTLLCKCSYQVTIVKSAREVIDVLNAEGSEIDIILSEVDLPMNNGLKMLKYIIREKDWRRIPVIMMSAQDEESVVVKCLRLGAADYLVKPLRTNELLNLWTHMWRRRQMLGLSEKNILNCEFDHVASDPSDANTNSTALFSDDTQHEYELNLAGTADIIEPFPVKLMDCQPDIPGISDRRRGQLSSYLKETELRIGDESSAFFTYLKSNQNPPLTNHIQAAPLSIDMNAPSDHMEKELNDHDKIEEDDIPSSSSFPDSPILLDNQKPNNWNFYPYYIPGAMTQFMMTPINHIFPHYAPGVSSFPCWNIPYNDEEEEKLKVDRRKAALIKFRQKRKERCFDKKIRYVNRKQLAERRPRIRGQFVRKIDVDLNCDPSSSADE
ncbi:two-component response regulator-like APRR1 [Impatiens glandulifera]|uniref:two-component response regulator-like APRR1 n=1 Tax=Impatiens glandulifera TaxID=253017 RepID=UPI001FB12938|nr:two-component response regulator-like APRR1 [Impatiens glandulifera]